MTTTADDEYGNRIQTPPFWKMLPGTAKEGFVGTLLAQDGIWKTHWEALLRTAESYRRKGSDKPVFDLRPLARSEPDGTLIPRTDD